MMDELSSSESEFDTDADSDIPDRKQLIMQLVGDV